MNAQRRQNVAMARHIQQIQLNLQEFAMLARRTRRTVPTNSGLKETTLQFPTTRRTVAELEAETVEFAALSLSQETAKLVAANQDTRVDLTVTDQEQPVHKPGRESNISVMLD